MTTERLTCPGCLPDLWAGYVFQSADFERLCCDEHRVAGAAEPSHPTRDCPPSLHIYVDGRPEWCIICGWPETHTEPAAVITGILNTPRSPWERIEILAEPEPAALSQAELRRTPHPCETDPDIYPPGDERPVDRCRRCGLVRIAWVHDPEAAL